MQQAVDTPPQGSTMTTTTGPSEVGTTAAPQPPIGRYRRVPVQVHQADPDAPEVARRLIALIATRWPATPAEHIGSTAVPGLAGKNIIDLLLAADPARIPAITKALLELGFQPQVPAASPATRPMLWGTFRHRATTYRVHVHVVPASSPEVAAMRGLRDALRADPVLRRRHGVLKRAIVAGGPSDPVAFTRAKQDWIAATLAQLGLADEQPAPAPSGRPRSGQPGSAGLKTHPMRLPYHPAPLPCLAIGCSPSLLQPRKAWVLGRAGLEERIPSPLTLASDLGKRRSAQR